MYFVYSFLFCTDLILYGTAVEYAKNWYDIYITKPKFLSRREFITVYTANYLSRDSN